MTTKKGQGLSLNTIIIAIIVLIVLVVLVMIFTGYFGKIFTPTVKSCATQGGACVVKCNEGSYGGSVPGGDCPTGTTCCAKVKDVGFGVDIKDKAESCTAQSGSCKSATAKEIDDKGKEVTVTATCTDYGMAAFGAPGCPSGTMCCK
ncbi:hypothetical protein HYV83_03910 [Candidatus Woesearchaeota archaeon]|nr:hypothetical protein [Candidatus Woesearchaeota archaeon]